MFKAKPLIKDRPIRVGLVGCGRISGKHFEALKKYGSDIQLAGVCDSNPQALAEYSKRYEVEGYSELAQMLAQPDIDLVVLSTPSGLHSSQVIQCAEAGKHVVTEKPMATRWIDGKRMVKACDDAGVHLFVVKQNRLNPTLVATKKAIESGRFGSIYMMLVNVLWTRPQDYYDSAAWRGTWEFDGGALMNQASHYIDLMEWLVGPVESVQCTAATIARNIEVEDSAVLNVKWRSGAIGSASVTMLAHRKNFEGSITILGEKGTIRIGGVALNQILHWDFAEESPDDAEVMKLNYEPPSVYGNGHIPYYQNIIECLRDGKAPLTDGREGLRSLELLIAAYLSAREGNRITLPLEY